MLDIITSFLIQNRQVALPGIGVLNITSKPAEINKANNLLMPPEDKIVFSESNLHSPLGLVNYIAHKKNINDDDAEDELGTFCEDWKQKINSGEKLCFETLGCLRENENGLIVFDENRNVQFLIPLPATVLHEDATHLSTTDKIENIHTVTKEYYPDVVETKSVWLQWAMILCAVALVTLFFHYYDRRFSIASTGNQSNFSIASPDSTWFTPEQ